MNTTTVLVSIAVLGWVMYRQYVGRFVSRERAFTVPLVLVALGLWQAGQAHLQWSTTAILVVGGSLLLTAALGVVRGAAIGLTAVDGYLYQRGGLMSVGLWILTIGVRVLVEVLAIGTSAGPAMTATITLSIGVSLAVQAAVLAVRVQADGRPVRPSANGGVGNRRSTRARATLNR